MSDQRDEIGDLFAVPSLARKANSSSSSFVFGVLLLAVVAFFLWQNLPREDRHEHQDQQEQKDDSQQDKSDSDRQSASGGVVVFVLELQTKSADQELVLRSMSETVVAKQLSGYRVFDDDSKDAEQFMSFAKSKGKDSPLMFLVKDKQILRLESFPSSVTYQAVESFLK